MSNRELAKELYNKFENGEIIIINPDKTNEKIKNYDGALFIKINDEIFTLAPALGWVKRTDYAKTPDAIPEKLQQHFCNMLDEGMNISTICPGNWLMCGE